MELAAKVILGTLAFFALNSLANRVRIRHRVKQMILLIWVVATILVLR